MEDVELAVDQSHEAIEDAYQVYFWEDVLVVEDSLEVSLAGEVRRDDLEVTIGLNRIKYLFLVVVKFEVFQILPQSMVGLLTFLGDLPHQKGLLGLLMCEAEVVRVKFLLVVVEFVEKEVIGAVDVE